MGGLINNMPDFIDNYSYALVRIAVLAPPAKGERLPLQLVAAVISLVANGDDLPVRTAKESCFRLPNKQGSLFYDELIMTAKKAVDWYRSTPDSLVTPIPNSKPRANDGKPLQASDWQELPSLPVLGARYDEEFTFFDGASNHLPFTVNELTQFHRRLTADDNWAVEQANSIGSCIYHSPEAVEFLHQRLHINFHDYPEYLGGMCLLVPNTQVQAINLSLTHCEQGHESLAIHVIAQPGKNFQGLSIIYTAVQDDVLTHCQQYSVPSSGFLLVPHQGKLHQAGLVLTHKEQGVLLHKSLTSFYRQMTSRISSSSLGNLISVPSTDKANAPHTTYAAADYLDNNVTVIGEGPTAVEERIARSAGARNLRWQSKRYDQQWFSAGDREQALKFVRSKLKNARQRIIIADPYFDKLQIEQLLYAVPQGDCNVYVLTNADVFKAENNKGSRLLKVQEFASTLSKLLNIHSLKNLNIKVAVDAEAKFHDRFLIVDDSAWLLGSSLNSLGTQPTMIIRIPNAKVVIVEIEALMAKAQSFTDYFEALQ